MPNPRPISYCSICGVPFLGWRADGAWISRVTLLSEQEPNILPLKMQNKHLQHEPGLVFQSISEDGIHETAAESYVQVGPERFTFFSTGEKVPARSDRYVFSPVHEACLQIAKHVMRVCTTNPAVDHTHRRVTSMRQLWEVLESYVSVTLGGIRTQTRPLNFNEPYDYNLPSFLRGPTGRRINAYRDDLDPYVANPLDIRDLSSVVLSYLQTYPPECSRNASTSHVKLAESLKSLPNELFDQIIDSMWPIKNLPLQCTRLIDPVHWQRLLTSRFLPYLWDLDISVVQCCLADDKWDYEFLVRQLTQEGIWEYFNSNDSGKYIHGIWNRQRIWRLVEKMEVKAVVKGDETLPITRRT